MKPTAPFEVRAAAKAVAKYGSSAEMIQKIMTAAEAIKEYGENVVMRETDPDMQCTFTKSAAVILAEWVLENFGPEAAESQGERMTPAEHPFTPGYCAETFESGPGYAQRHMLYVAWSDGGLIASDQAYPKIPTRRYTDENIGSARLVMRDVWKFALGHFEQTAFDTPKQCRIYRDDTILYVATSGMTWVVPHDDNGRVECFTASTFRDSWLFEGGALPSIVTSRPAAMAAFAYAGLV